MKRSSSILAILNILAILVLVLWLPACNTTKGLGTDIEKAGSGLKHSAERSGAR